MSFSNNGPMNSLARRINCADERLRLMYKMYLCPLNKGNKANYITELNWANPVSPSDWEDM